MGQEINVEEKQLIHLTDCGQSIGVLKKKEKMWNNN